MKLENYKRVKELVSDIEKNQEFLDSIRLDLLSVVINKIGYPKESIEISNIDHPYNEIAREFIINLKTKVTSKIAELKTELADL